MYTIYNLSNEGNIIVGYENGILGDNVTREQVAALLYRAHLKGYVKDDQILHIQGKSLFANPYHDINENSTMFLKEFLIVTELGIFKRDQKGCVYTRGGGTNN
ncbi:hypothetical protein [Bacillus sp. CH_70]|uniref:hypothetical protein n=1 Tax=Bacillus sp. CH_70 TaxID=2978215 RepID=UPI0030F4F2BB